MKRRNYSDSESSPETPQKKRKFIRAVKAPKPSTRAIMKHNQTTSPLLRLPREIRDQIWTLVLGDQNLFIGYHCNCRDCSGRYGPCNEIKSQNGNQELRSGWSMYFPAAPLAFLDTRRRNPDIYHPSNHELSSFWKENGDDFEHCAPPSAPGVDIRLLRVCRQTYEEASDILYSTNAFSFLSCNALGTFLHDRSPTQKGFLRHICFEMDPGRNYAHNDLFGRIAFVRSLRALKTLHIYAEYTIFHQSEAELTRGPWPWSQAHQDEHFYWLFPGLYKLSVLPLENVKIAFRFTEYGVDAYEPSAFAMSWADDLRRRLLDPEGYEDWLVDREAARKTARQGTDVENTHFAPRLEISYGRTDYRFLLDP